MECAAAPSLALAGHGMEPVVPALDTADSRMIIVESTKDVNVVWGFASKLRLTEPVVEALALPVSEASLEFVALRLDGVAQPITTVV